MTHITDDLLAAYVDGELSTTEREQVERELAEDAELAARVARQRALRSRLSARYDRVLDEPMPERLLQAARTAVPGQGAAQIISLARARAGRTQPERVRRGRLFSHRVAIAASLLVGVCAGLLTQRLHTGNGITELRDGALLARGPLDNALSHQLSGVDSSHAMNIGLTFRAKDGAYCRTFSVNAAQGLSGLACRERQHWRVLALLTQDGVASGSQNMRMAASPPVPGLLQAVNARISGEPLDEQAEARARDQDWR